MAIDDIDLDGGGGPAALAVVHLPRHEGEAWQRYHAAEGTTILVRPDAHVCWRTPTAPSTANALSQILRTVLG